MRFAVIPTYDRPTELMDCVDRIAPQVDVSIIVVNGDYPLEVQEWVQAHAYPIVVFGRPQQPPNLSQLWNVGLGFADQFSAGEPYKVAVLNDDAVPLEGWFDCVEKAMDATDADAGCTDNFGVIGEEYRLYKLPMTSPMERLCGWAFVLRGGIGLYADEDLEWWYGDTALDYNARVGGGMVIARGPQVVNLYPNASTTGVLAEQAGRDRATYLRKYGDLPW